ncbi:hypothetical protein LJR168_001969 [Pseudoxanthomonas sp. LjRoot168]|uniref:hypothetical protein n=1 Tax=unclassified Pseudoxanthomonas TaxID=2645906 RepID=UPI003ECE7F43
MSHDQPIRALFAPEAMPVRDESGYAHHPDLDRFMVGDEPDDITLDTHAIRDAGFEVSFHGLDVDHDEGEPEHDEYWADGGGVTKWQPSSPDGEGWQLVAVYDTEDFGPQSLWLRKVAA